jgi:hypothetical protein
MIMLPANIAAVATVLSLTSAQPNSVLLRYHFQRGATHDYLMTVTTKMSMGGQASGFNMDMRMDTRQKVVSVASDGTATLQGKVLNMSMTMNGQPIDAGKKGTGQTFTMKMSPTGKLSDMHMPGMNTSSMGGGMNFEGMQFGTRLPAGPVRPGSTWSSGVEMPGMGSITLQNRLDRVYSNGRSTLAEIESSGSIDLGKMIRKMAPQLQGMSGGGRANIDMRYTFDQTLGLVRSMSGGGTYSLEMSTGRPSGRGPSSMKMTGSSQITMQIRG